MLRSWCTLSYCGYECIRGILCLLVGWCVVCRSVCCLFVSLLCVLQVMCLCLSAGYFFFFFLRLRGDVRGVASPSCDTHMKNSNFLLTAGCDTHMIIPSTCMIDGTSYFSLRFVLPVHSCFSILISFYINEL